MPSSLTEGLGSLSDSVVKHTPPLFACFPYSATKLIPSPIFNLLLLLGLKWNLKTAEALGEGGVAWVGGGGGEGCP